MVRRTPRATRAPALALGFALLLVTAGCLTPGRESEKDPPETGRHPFLAGPPLWHDPQNTPHPAYGWPTLNHPTTSPIAPPLWQPFTAAPLPDRITGIRHVAKAPIIAGAGIAIFGSIAFVPSGGSAPAKILNLTDPAAPTVLSETPGTTGRGSSLIAYPDGRLVAVVSIGTRLDVVNLTNPTEPELLTSITPRSGAHKLGVVPGTPIVYNAGSDGGKLPWTDLTGNVKALAQGFNEIYDLTDPEKPILVQDFNNGHSCHHIFFWIQPAKQRALCAGVEVTQIWDIADPRKPTVVAEVPVHHGNPAVPATAIVPFLSSHAAWLTPDGNTLIVGDEWLVNLPSECTGPSPLGALWFYDARNEAAPRLLGYWSAPPHLLSNPIVAGCTAHHGRFVPSEGRHLLSIAWSTAGVILLDVTDPASVRILDQWMQGTNTWEAWYANGHIITGDVARGMDIFLLR